MEDVKQAVVINSMLWLFAKRAECLAEATRIKPVRASTNLRNHHWPPLGTTSRRVSRGNERSEIAS
jgi:hypothetical protein